LECAQKNSTAFAHRFDQAGYRVTLLSRSTDYSGEPASKLSDARAHVYDASDPASVNAAFAQTEEQMGNIDVLVHNPGNGSWQTVEEISPRVSSKAGA
jgi:NADP-dependent 3-hydroxy acid dehydrogenase YdfG